MKPITHKCKIVEYDSKLSNCLCKLLIPTDSLSSKSFNCVYMYIRNVRCFTVKHKSIITNSK